MPVCRTLIHIPNRHFCGCLVSNNKSNRGFNISPSCISPSPLLLAGYSTFPNKLPDSRLKSQIKHSPVTPPPGLRLWNTTQDQDLIPGSHFGAPPCPLSRKVTLVPRSNRKSPFENLRAPSGIPSVTVRHPVSVLNLFTAFNSQSISSPTRDEFRCQLCLLIKQ